MTSTFPERYFYSSLNRKVTSLFLDYKRTWSDSDGHDDKAAEHPLTLILSLTDIIKSHTEVSVGIEHWCVCNGLETGNTRSQRVKSLRLQRKRKSQRGEVERYICKRYLHYTVTLKAIFIYLFIYTYTLTV